MRITAFRRAVQNQPSRLQLTTIPLRGGDQGEAILNLSVRSAWQGLRSSQCIATGRVTCYPDLSPPYSRALTEGSVEPPAHWRVLVPINQLLFNEQVTLIRAAESLARAGHSEAKATGKPVRSAVRANPSAKFGATTEILRAKLSSPQTVELLPAQLSAIDQWADHWNVTRDEAVARLLERGMGETSHLMRSS